MQMYRLKVLMMLYIDMAEDIESGQMEAIDDTLHFEFDREFTINTNSN